MRILHIFSNPHLTHGASVFEYRISEYLAQDGIYFDYLVSGEATPEEEARYQKMGSRLHCLPVDEKCGLVLREIKANIQYYKFFKTHDYKIVYADTENALRAMHLLMARLAGVSVRVVHSHNTQLQTTSRASRMIARAMRNLFRFSANHYFACSDLAAQWLFPKSVCRKKQYTVLKNGVNLNRFRFDPQARTRIRSALGLENQLVLGHIGRFMPQKNHAKLIDIFAAVSEINPNAQLMLIGDGPLKEDTLRLAREKNLLNRVHFVGNVADVSAYLHAMDVFVMPSLFEGLPVTGVEAQAAGLPCVFSDPITREVQITDAAVYLPLDAENSAWAERICALAAEGRRDTEAQIIHAGFSIDTTVDALRAFYQKHNGDAPL